MADQWNQLRLLLWKNYLLKRRQPLVLFLEIPFPLILAIILVIVRSQNKGEDKDTFKNWPRAQPSAGFVPFAQSIWCREITGEQFNVDLDANGFPNLTFTPAMVLTNVLQSLSSLDDEEWRRIYAIPQHVQLLATQLNNSQFFHFLEQNFSSVADAVEYLSGPLVSSSLNSSELNEVLKSLPLSSSDATALSSATLNWLELYKDLISDQATGSRSRRSTSSDPVPDSSTSLCDSLSLLLSPLAVQACKVGLGASSALLPEGAASSNVITLLKQLASTNVSVPAARQVVCSPEQFFKVFSFPSSVPLSNQTQLQQDLCELSDAQLSELLFALLNSTSRKILANNTLTPENIKILTLIRDLYEDAQLLNSVMARLQADDIDIRPLAMFYRYLVTSPTADLTTRSGRKLFVRQVGAFLCADNLPRLAGPPDNSFALKLLILYMVSPRSTRPTEAPSSGGGGSSDETNDETNPSGDGTSTASDLQIQNEVFNEIIARAANGRLRVLFAPNNTLTQKIVKKMLQPLDDFKEFVVQVNSSYWNLSQSWQLALTSLDATLNSTPAVQFITDFCPSVETFYNISDRYGGRHSVPWNSSLAWQAQHSVDQAAALLQNATAGVLGNSSYGNVTNPFQWQPFVAEFCGDLRLLRFFLGEDALVPPGLVATSHGLFLFPDYRLNPNRTLLANLLDLDIVMRSSVNSSLGIQADGWLLGAKNETELEEIAANAWDYDLTVLAGLVFNNLNDSDNTSAANETSALPPHVDYTLRQNASMVTSTRWTQPIYWTPGPCLTLFCRRYEIFGFLTLQDLVDKAIIELQTSNGGFLLPESTQGFPSWFAANSSQNESISRDNTLGSWLQNFPYPCYLYDEFTTMSAVILPTAVFLSFLFSVAMLVKNVVYEKEQRLKEVMKVMGLSNGIHLVAWFITSVIPMLIPVTLLAITLKYGGILQYSDVTIIWLYIFVFAVSCIGFSFFLSVFFSRANLGASWAAVLFFSCFFPYMVLFIHQDVAYYRFKALACLLSPSAFSFATQYATYYEQQQKGLQWDNLPCSPLTDDPFSFKWCLIFMASDCVLYFLLAWYLDHVLPSRYGIRRPWYFPFQVSYWKGDEWVARREMMASSRHSNLHVFADAQHDLDNGEEFNRDAGNGNQSRGLLEANEDGDSLPGDLTSEGAPVGLRPGVVIRNLTKCYAGAQQNAVDGLSVSFYEGQITSFLGHNGAGKTTTMSVLTGLHTPTDGTIIVQGLDIRTDIHRIRRSLGFCPQHNVLFDRLTVEEHMIFYSRIKKVSREEVESNLTKWLTDVGLLDKRHCLTKNLSGGMKRKLSVAIAFVGGSKTVVLDEPTAGIDPYARRAIWDLLVRYRDDGRTIILSTHHMDEADILGDRVAIIAQGRLRCVGSSMFLKSRFGRGYTLTLVKHTAKTCSPRYTGSSAPPPQLSEDASMLCDVSKLTSVISQHVSGSQLLISHGNSVSEIAYRLPSEGAHNGSFQRLFNYLDLHLQSLGVESYGLTDSSLEEVFMALTCADDAEALPVGKASKKSRLCAACKRLLCFGSCCRTTDCCNAGQELSVVPPSQHRSNAGRRGNGQGSVSVNVADGDLAGMRQPTGRSSDMDGVHGDGVQLLQAAAGDEFNDDAETDGVVTPVDMTTRQGAASLLTDLHRSSTLSGYRLVLQQFRALFIKRFHHARRNRMTFFAQVVLPAILVAVVLLLNVYLLQTPGDDPSMTLLPSSINEGKNKFTPIKNYDTDSLVNVKRILSILHPCGLGTEHLWSNATFKNSNKTFNASTCYNYAASNIAGVLPVDNFINVTHQPVPFQASGDSFPTDTGDFEPRLYRYPLNLTEENISDELKCGEFKVSNPNSCTNCSVYPRRCNSVPQTIGQASALGYSVLQNLDRQHIDMDNWILRTTGYYVLKRWGAVSVGSEVLTVVNSSTPYAFVNALARRPANRAWNNLNGYHAAPIYMNVLTNALLRGGLNETQDPVLYGVTTSNHPFSKTAIQLEEEYTQAFIELANAISVILALSFVPPSFVLYLIRERARGAKHLQRMTGVSGVTYWLSTFCWDMVNYLVTVVTLLIAFALFGKGVYTSADNFPAVMCLLLLYGWSITPLMYPFSFYFEIPSTAYVILLCGNVAIGAFGTIATFFLQLFPDNAVLTEANDHLRTALLIFPNFCLGRGLMDVAYLHYGRKVAKELGASWYVVKPSIGLDVDQVGRNLISMAVAGVFFFLITLGMEYGVFSYTEKRIRSRVRTLRQSLRASRGYSHVRLDESPEHGAVSQSTLPSSTQSDSEAAANSSSATTGSSDDDVCQETQRVLTGQTDGDMLILKNLTKYYKKHQAVKELCLGVQPGICFGLLGVNGAGKTSTFKMLTGEEKISSGDAILSNLSVLQSKADVRRLMGYCPQFDALDDLLTAREHLMLYARLRGVPEAECTETVNTTIKSLQLLRYADSVSSGYSGGNKRKLSTAISLVGRPPVILLDEPTTGMDVKARRFLWSVIHGLALAGHCIIFTSHNMEECETLCHRLAIMVNGEFRCLGSPQHLKSKFGDGYTLSIRLKSSQAGSGDHAGIKRFCEQSFTDAVLQDEHHNLLVYQLSGKQQSLAIIFGLLGDVRQQYQIEDFSLSQTSLDRVFISFAKHQSEDDKNIAIARVQDSQASRGDRREQRSAEAGRDGTVQSYAVYSHEHRSVTLTANGEALLEEEEGV